MCGFFGSVYKNNYDSDINININVIKRNLHHRGPNNLGVYKDSYSLFIHSRLSVIDLTEKGNQPFEDDEYVLVYNGEIYNFLELQKELELLGYNFFSKCDTEIVFKSYKKWGAECFSKFNGDWSLAIYNKKTKDIILSRDRFSIKPLYYYYDNEKLYFSSEIKNILSAGIKKEIDQESLVDYLTFQYIPSNKTLYKNIYKVESGEYIKFNFKKIQKIKYWNINVDYKIKNEKSAIDELAYLLNDAVKLRLNADVPVGAHLSGGIDSGGICYFAKRNIDELQTYTGAFKEKNIYDDTYYSSITAEYLGTNHNVIYITKKMVNENIDHILWLMDEPAAGEGVIPQYFVAQLSSENDVVVLGGQGADEIFGGYIRYYIVLIIYDLLNNGNKSNSYFKNINQLKKYAPLFKKIMSGNGKKLEDIYFDSIKRIAKINIKKYLGNSNISSKLFEYSKEKLKTFLKNEKCEPLDKLLLWELSYSLPALIQVDDRTTMGNSIESRIPFLDHRIVEFAFNLHPDIKMKNGRIKYILRKMLEDKLPKKIIKREDKIGFPVPFKNYINDDFDNNNRIKYSDLTGREFWASYNLDFYQNRYNF